MNYQEVLQILFDNKNDQRAIFNTKIINSKINNLGVSSSIVLDLSKKLANERNDLLDFEINKYHEINMIISLTNVLRKDKTVEEKFQFLEQYFQIVDNWAIVDSTISKFKIKKLDDIKKYILKFHESEYPFVRRACFVILLKFVNKENASFIKDLLNNDSDYYCFMAQAWLISQFAIKGLKEDMISILENKDLSNKLINKGIAKACESYRVSDEDKLIYKSYRR